mmetsp:Transcript_4528/g.10727  ORF Transcript_4528/g.10727 Transcript_4528/m.10727 type:complete len:247 (+) Transcript_4528:335-1075(+)
MFPRQVLFQDSQSVFFCLSGVDHKSELQLGRNLGLSLEATYHLLLGARLLLQSIGVFVVVQSTLAPAHNLVSALFYSLKQLLLEAIVVLHVIVRMTTKGDVNAPPVQAVACIGEKNGIIDGLLLAAVVYEELQLRSFRGGSSRRDGTAGVAILAGTAPTPGGADAAAAAADVAAAAVAAAAVVAVVSAVVLFVVVIAGVLAVTAAVAAVAVVVFVTAVNLVIATPTIFVVSVFVVCSEGPIGSAAA